eukprot:4913072-Amphidinium_carterae.1
MRVVIVGCWTPWAGAGIETSSNLDTVTVEGGLMAGAEEMSSAAGLALKDSSLASSGGKGCTFSSIGAILGGCRSCSGFSSSPDA